MQDDECLGKFRVKKEDIPALAEALQVPETVTCVLCVAELNCCTCCYHAWRIRVDMICMIHRFGKPGARDLYDRQNQWFSYLIIMPTD